MFMREIRLSVGLLVDGPGLRGSDACCSRGQNRQDAPPEPSVLRVQLRKIIPKLLRPPTSSAMAFPGGANGMPGMNPNAGMSEQEQQMIKLVLVPSLVHMNLL